MNYFLPVSEQIIILQKLIRQAEESFFGQAEGSVIVRHSHGRDQFYYKKDSSCGSGTYLSLKEKDRIISLVQKDYDQRFLRAARKLLSELIHLQESNLERSASNLYQPLSEVYSHLPDARKKLVHPYILPDDLFVEEWLSQSYNRLPFREDDIRLQTNRGDHVRSKSEKIIADSLFSLQKAYLHDYPVYLEGYGWVFADFLILDLRERKTVILEHFGLMQDPDYCQHAMAKIDAYRQNGYFPGDRFLCTFEGGRYVLQIQSLNALIKQRFC